MTAWPWVIHDLQVLPADHTLVMGILNVTPDSFSDGGRYHDTHAAVEAALQMIADGADIIDIGAESTNPSRSAPVDADEELRRLMPVLRELRARAPHALISVDTYKAKVAGEALEAGADIINDVYGLRYDPSIADVVARYGAGLIIMHMQGTPETMQASPTYQNLLVDIKNELRAAMETAMERGVREQAIAVDPGFGFGKTLDHNIELLAQLEYFGLLQRPLCVGVSRKRFLGALLAGADVHEREEATRAAEVIAAMNGAAIVRTHNVKAACRALKVADAVLTRA
jgi:dihydropteroate synthase